MPGRISEKLEEIIPRGQSTARSGSRLSAIGRRNSLDPIARRTGETNASARALDRSADNPVLRRRFPTTCNPGALVLLIVGLEDISRAGEVIEDK